MADSLITIGVDNDNNAVIVIDEGPTTTRMTIRLDVEGLRTLRDQLTVVAAAMDRRTNHAGQ